MDILLDKYKGIHPGLFWIVNSWNETKKKALSLKIDRNTGAALLTIGRRRVKEIDDLCVKYKHNNELRSGQEASQTCKDARWTMGQPLFGVEIAAIKAEKFLLKNHKKWMIWNLLTWKTGTDSDAILDDSATYSKDHFGFATALLTFGYRFTRIEAQQNFNQPTIDLEKDSP